MEQRAKERDAEIRWRQGNNRSPVRPSSPQDEAEAFDTDEYGRQVLSTGFGNTGAMMALPEHLRVREPELEPELHFEAVSLS